MELRDALYQRRTVRGFKPEPIPEEILLEILDAGIQAPTHNNTQPWEFVLIGPETREKLRQVFVGVLEAGPLQSPVVPDDKKEKMRAFMQDFGGAPVLLAVLYPAANNPLDKYDFPLTAAAAIQNIGLAAWEKGIGNVWLSFGFAPAAQEILGVEENGGVAGILAMGYPAFVPPALPRIPAGEKMRRLP